MDQSSISVLLKRVERRVFDQLNEEVTEAKGRQTSQLEYLASEAIDAWERSKLDAESVEETEEQTTIKAPGSAGGKELPAAVLKTKRVRKGQTGDPRHLDNAMKALTDIRAIWGIEAPKKSDVMSGGQRFPFTVIEVVRPALPAPDSDPKPE
jgi:hypothetical protein